MKESLVVGTKRYVLVGYKMSCDQTFPWRFAAAI